MARGKKSEENKEKNRKRSKADESKPNTDAAATEAEEKPDVAEAGAKKKNPRIAHWEEPEQLILLEGWARDGDTMDTIAQKMKISRATLYNWTKQSLDILDTLKKGKEVVDYTVENALLTAALSGNVTAQIFWLKNRCPDKWKEKTEQKIDADVEHKGGLAFIAPRLEE